MIPTFATPDEVCCQANETESNQSQLSLPVPKMCAPISETKHLTSLTTGVCSSATHTLKPEISKPKLDIQHTESNQSNLSSLPVPKMCDPISETKHLNSLTTEVCSSATHTLKPEISELKLNIHHTESNQSNLLSLPVPKMCAPISETKHLTSLTTGVGSSATHTLNPEISKSNEHTETKEVKMQSLNVSLLISDYHCNDCKDRDKATKLVPLTNRADLEQLEDVDNLKCWNALALKETTTKVSRVPEISEQLKTWNTPCSIETKGEVPNITVQVENGTPVPVECTDPIDLYNACRFFYQSRLESTQRWKERWRESERFDNECSSKPTLRRRYRNPIEKAMATLKKEMACLMELDLCLMKQLLTMNEEIEDLKWRRRQNQSGWGSTSSCYSSCLGHSSASLATVGEHDSDALPSSPESRSTNYLDGNLYLLEPSHNKQAESHLLGNLLQIHSKLTAFRSRTASDSVVTRLKLKPS